ncbi:MAG TPA: SRPBCC family protein [Burkholderiales bacterium]
MLQEAEQVGLTMAEKRRGSVAWKWWIPGSVLALALAAAAAALAPAPAAPVWIHGEAVIARPPQEVFDFVTTPANWPKWHPSSLGVSGATNHPLAVGEQVTEDFMVAGRRGRVVWTVTERKAPALWRIEGQGEEGGRAWITYTLTAQAGGTRYERDLRYRMPNLLAALLDPLLTRARIAQESATAVRQLQQVLERGGAT